MYHFSNDVSSANDYLYAESTQLKNNTSYSFKRLEYPNVYIPNCTAAHCLSFLPEDSEEKNKTKKTG